MVECCSTIFYLIFLIKTSDTPVVVTVSYSCSKEKLWAAVTELNQMRQWYFQQIPSYQAEVGFTTSFLIEHEGRRFTHIWEITRVEPMEFIETKWTFDEYPGSSLSLFTIVVNDESATLTVKDTVIENFPTDIPEFKRESCLGGWTYFLNEALKSYLEE